MHLNTTIVYVKSLLGLKKFQGLRENFRNLPVPSHEARLTKFYM